MSKLQGKVAIVTGAASGIGRASALALARAGARVVLVDLNEAGAKQVVDDVRAAAGEAIACEADVSLEDDVRRMVALGVDAFGGLDVLHNNVAASDADTIGRDADLLDLEVEIWDRAMAVNARSVMLGCKHGIPAMLERGGGSIINTSSVAGLTGDLTRAAYGASKGAVNTLTLMVAAMYGKQGIRCNAVAPGVIQTPSLETNVPRAHLQAYHDSNLVPRLGRPEDIAHAVTWLASDESEYVTGQILRVDGGALSHHPTIGQIRNLA